MRSDIENAKIIVHDRLEPPILRKTSSDYLWEEYSFYRIDDNTIHILNPELFKNALILYQKERVVRLSQNRLYRIGRLSVAKMAAISVGLFALAVLFGHLNVPLIATPLVFAAVFFWPFVYFILRTAPDSHTIKIVRAYLKNTALSS